jgi:hypothetical protein
MISTRHRSPSSTTVSKTFIEKVASTLQDLPEKPKEELLLREAMEEMYDDLAAALAKGYSLEEMVAILNDKGIDINIPSLKYYMSRIGRKRNTATAPKARKTRRTKKATTTPKTQPGSQSETDIATLSEIDAETEPADDQPVDDADSSLLDEVPEGSLNGSTQPEDTTAAEEPAEMEEIAATPAKRTQRASSTTRSKPRTRGKTRTTA